MSQYELFIVNEPWKRKKTETYRGDLTLAYYKTITGCNVDSQQGALMLKLGNLQGVKEATLFDNTGAIPRRKVLFVKQGVIEINLLTGPHDPEKRSL